MAQVTIIVQEDVHIRVYRGFKRALDLRELVYSHILLPVKVRFGREARFEWIDPQSDWVRFCAGEEIMVQITGGKQPTIAAVCHGDGRVVYVNVAEE